MIYLYLKTEKNDYGIFWYLDFAKMSLDVNYYGKNNPFARNIL